MDNAQNITNKYFGVKNVVFYAGFTSLCSFEAASNENNCSVRKLEMSDCSSEDWNSADNKDYDILSLDIILVFNGAEIPFPRIFNQSYIISKGLISTAFIYMAIKKVSVIKSRFRDSTIFSNS